ncbi:MAG: MGMT family protein [Actinomycetota bacterium]
MGTRSRFAGVARLVRRGEWTSYGDIAAAAGVPRAARAVGRDAATSDDFPNAHRVLRHDGTVAGSYADGSEREGRVRRLLENEGVLFSAAGRADPAAAGVLGRACPKTRQEAR